VRHEVEELDADNQAGCNKLLLAFFPSVTRPLSGITGF